MMNKTTKPVYPETTAELHKEMYGAPTDAEVEELLFGGEASEGDQVYEDHTAITDSVVVTTSVDMYFLVDGTRSTDFITDYFKEFISTSDKSIAKALGEKKREVGALSIAVILYRDAFYDKNDWITTSPKFMISDGPEQREALLRYLEGITPSGGGDEPESILEAYSYVFKSGVYKPLEEGEKRRVLFFSLSDSCGHKLDDPRRENNRYLPDYIAKDMNELSAQLAEFVGPENLRNVRIFQLVFGKNSYPWDEMPKYLPQVVTFTSEDGSPMDPSDLSVIPQCVSNSI